MPQASFEPDAADSTELPLAPNWVRVRTSDGQRIFYQHTIHRKKQTDRPIDSTAQRAMDNARLEQGVAYWHAWASKVNPEDGSRVYHNMRTGETTDVKPEGFALTAVMQRKDQERAALVENGLWVRRSSANTVSSTTITTIAMTTHHENENSEDVEPKWNSERGMEEPSGSCGDEEEWNRHQQFYRQQSSSQCCI